MTAYAQIGLQLVSLLERFRVLESYADKINDDYLKRDLIFTRSAAMRIAEIWCKSPEFNKYRDTNTDF